jgi:5-methylcytosine-specific restriction enzyme A
MTGQPSSEKTGYGHRRWRRNRLRHLQRHPLCVLCEQRGLTTAARVVDHIRRHRGITDPLFWDSTNWQSLCFRCHNSVKQQIDQRGAARGCDEHGMPLYPRRDNLSPDQS